MGNGRSQLRKSPEARDAKELEARLAAVGDLSMLQVAFSRISTPASAAHNAVVDLSALQDCFQLVVPHVSSELHLLTTQVGLGLVDAVFELAKGDVDWIKFLKGFDRCCKQSLGVKLKLLFVFFYNLLKRAQVPLTFSMGNENCDVSFENEFVGCIVPRQFQELLWICWLIMCQSNYRGVGGCEKSPLKLPDVEPLVRAASMACYVTDKKNTEQTDFTVHSIDGELSVEKLPSWMLSTIVGLSDCLCQYVRAQLNKFVSSVQDQSSNQFVGGIHITDQAGTNISAESSQLLGLLTPGVAWAISLSQPDVVGSKLATTSFTQIDTFVDLLYRSSIHGRGMNRFWSQVEGYKGAVLILIAGSLQQSEGSPHAIIDGKRWIVGALFKEGFENKDSYYGSPGCCLFALSPVFLPLRCTGKGSNYLYTHTHAPGSIYQGQERCNGIAFGGDYGKERLWLDEDFAWLTVRHHAVDKTYQSGMLLPNQGYAPMKGRVVEVEVWGLGGKAAQELQAAFQKRETLFSEQRRKVELKSFGNWTDSPEKMMMDMVSDPNKVKREER